MIAKLMRIANDTCRNEAPSPMSCASIPLSSAFPSAVSSRISGNFVATKSAINGERHEPIAAPYSPAPTAITTE